MRVLRSFAIISMLFLTCAYGEEAKKSDAKEEKYSAKVDTSDMRY